jgi:hypothetical protein
MNFLVLEKFHYILILKNSLIKFFRKKINFDTIMTFFWIHIFHFPCVTNTMSSSQKSIMSPFFP